MVNDLSPVSSLSMPKRPKSYSFKPLVAMDGSSRKVDGSPMKPAPKLHKEKLGKRLELSAK